MRSLAPSSCISFSAFRRATLRTFSCSVSVCILWVRAALLCPSCALKLGLELGLDCGVGWCGISLGSSCSSEVLNANSLDKSVAISFRIGWLWWSNLDWARWRRVAADHNCALISCVSGAVAVTDDVEVDDIEDMRLRDSKVVNYWIVDIIGLQP